MTDVAIAILPDADARRTLAWGGGILAVGIALVGVGADHEGALPVLAGLLLTIFGIHTYGRLGPDERSSPHLERAAVRVRAAWITTWRGGLVAIAGAAIVFGASPEGLVRRRGAAR